MNKITQNRFLNNTVWLISERIIQMIVFLFVGALSARYLGPDNYGILNYTLSIINTFTTICGLGIESIIIRDIVRNRDKTGQILGSALVMRLIASSISIILIILTINILNPHDLLTKLVCFLQSLCLLFKTVDTLSLVFQANLQSKVVVKIKMIASIVIALWKIILLVSGCSVQWFALSITIESAIIAILLLISYKKKIKRKLQFSKITSINMIKEGYHFILSGMLVAIYTQIDKVMLGYILNQGSVGVYSVATTISGIWSFIPLAIINSATPIIIDLKGKDELLYQKRIKQLYCFIFYSGVIVNIFFVIFGKFIIYILYGVEYIDSYKALIIIIWASVFSLLGTARGAWIVSEGLNKYTKYYIGMGAIINVILNLILINRLGIVGISFATLAAQITVAFIAPIFIKRTRISTKLMLDAIALKGVIDSKELRRGFNEFKSKN